MEERDGIKADFVEKLGFFDIWKLVLVRVKSSRGGYSYLVARDTSYKMSSSLTHHPAHPSLG